MILHAYRPRQIFPNRRKVTFFFPFGQTSWKKTISIGSQFCSTNPSLLLSVHWHPWSFPKLPSRPKNIFLTMKSNSSSSSARPQRMFRKQRLWTMSLDILAPTTYPSANIRWQFLSGDFQKALVSFFLLKAHLIHHHFDCRQLWPDNTNPLGPCLVSNSLIPDPQSVELKLTLNGNIVQDGTTA